MYVHVQKQLLSMFLNTQERNTSEKQGKPGSIHHMSGRKVDVGGEGLIFKYMCTKLESEFLTAQDE